jgi:hypothetical protein
MLEKISTSTTDQRWAGHEVLMPGRTRFVDLASPPHLVPQLIFLNLTRARPARFRVGRLSAPPAYTRIFFIHHLIYFEWFILHNWLTYYKKIWDKVQTWLFEWIAADRTNMMSLTVDELILVLLCDWDVTIPTDEGTSLGAPFRFQSSFAHRYDIVV